MIWKLYVLDIYAKMNNTNTKSMLTININLPIIIIIIQLLHIPQHLIITPAKPLIKQQHILLNNKLNN